VILTSLVALSVLGCRKFKAKQLPAPLRENPVYTVEGSIGRVWGGDNFEFVEQNELRMVHYILVQGVDTPLSGQPFSTEAYNHVINSSYGKKIKVNVVARDEMKREIGDVFIVSDSDAPVNIGLDLLQRGLAWYDGNEFEGDEKYEAAEAEAREKKVGLWADENPVAPWDYVEP